MALGDDRAAERLLTCRVGRKVCALPLEQVLETMRPLPVEALPGVPRSGGFDAVDASSHNARANTVNGFMYSSGPARRFVGEMLPTIAATEIIPGGQSAVLGSPLYASQLGRWLTNNYHALPVNLAAATAASPTVTEFAP